MANGCVLRYEGPPRRVVAREVRRRRGPPGHGNAPQREPEWDRRKAERALGAKLAEVEKGLRKPRRRTFSDLAAEFDDVALAARPRKRSTLVDYRAMVRNHLLPAFGHLDLARLSRSPETFERYAAGKIAEGLSPKTVSNHLVLAGLMFKTARRWRWVSENPLELVEPPSTPDAETETLTAPEVASLLKAYRSLEAAADDADKPWFATARRMTVVALSTGLRRGELLGLTWQDCGLLERRLEVRQSFVRGEMTTPKSRAGRRSIPLGSHAVTALEEQYAETLYRSPDSVVFCHWALGTPLDPSKLTGYVRAALRKAGITKPFRPWHGLRHTSLTETAAAGVPSMFVQAKAGNA